MWLVRDGEVLAAAEIPAGPRARARGLLGRDGIDGVLVLNPCRNVHTVGMRFAIDVAFCDKAGRLLKTVTLEPRRISPLVLRAAYAIEGEAGAFGRWNLRVGDTVELRS